MKDEQATKKCCDTAERFAPYALPASIVIAGALIAAAIYSLGNGIQLPKLPAKGTINDTAQNPSLPSNGNGAVQVNVTDNDHIRGNKSAPVTIVEFSDLQCPFCKRFHPTMQQALQAYGDKVRWVYKHFPLDSLHPEARPAAEASECVWEQKGDDGFWQFVDGVFENQEKIGSALYRELAQKIGLNMGQFDNCVSSRKYQKKVEGDFQQGTAAGVNGTPTSFVNGEALPGAMPYDTLKAAIDRALAK
jgi:protein-disulfide isomerase